MLRRCPRLLSGPNLTTRLNAAALAKEGRRAAAAPRGIPRQERLEMKAIHTVYETDAVLVAGRHRVNGFNSNQFLVADKRAGECVLVDMADDWAPDWDAWIDASGLALKAIFFTHLHMDNVLGLPVFQHLRPGVPLAWNPAETVWVENFDRTAQRYGRPELKVSSMPFHEVGGSQHIVLSAATNRQTSFLQLGETLLCYIFTPGHSPGHTMLHLPQHGLLFSGDALSFDQVGRVDLPFASGRVLAQSLRCLEDLPDRTVLLPGHGRLTTLKREREHNRGLQRLYELMGAGITEPSVGFNKAGWF